MWIFRGAPSSSPIEKGRRYPSEREYDRRIFLEDQTKKKRFETSCRRENGKGRFIKIAQGNSRAIRRGKGQIPSATKEKGKGTSGDAGKSAGWKKGRGKQDKGRFLQPLPADWPAKKAFEERGLL